MKNRISLIVILLFIILGVGMLYEPIKSKFFNSKILLDFEHLPWLNFVVESIVFLYYEVPTDLDMIISVIEKCNENDPEFFSGYYESAELIREVTLPTLKKHRNKIYITSDENSMSLYLGEDKATFDLSYFLPCEKHYMEYTPWDYFRIYEKFEKGRYFDKDNFPIVGQEYKKIEEEFFFEKKQLDKEANELAYDYYMYEETKVPIRYFFEYKNEDQLYSFCDKQPLNSSLTYYKKVEELAERICQKYDLSRIIFMSLNYLV